MSSMMINSMRTGDVRLSGDGNYPASGSSNGQFINHNRTRHSTLGLMMMMTPNGNLKKTVNRPTDDVVKRTRSQNVYEMSQDLLDKQIELLERKYGGHARANHAARVIQRAFRHYSMRRKFATITAMAKAERRLSRRLHGEVEFPWDMSHNVATSATTTGATTTTTATSEFLADDSGTHAEYVIRSNFDTLYRELTETVEGSSRSARKSSSTHHARVTSQANPQMNATVHYQYQQQCFHSSHSQYETQYRHENNANPRYNSAVGHGNTPGQYSSNPCAVYGTGQAYGESRRADAKMAPAQNRIGKRIPPEVPRRTTSVLTKSPYSTAKSTDNSNDSTLTSRSTYSAANGGMNRADSRTSQTSASFSEERRTSNLSEHSASEDSLEGAGYNNSFWNESNVTNASQSHSSPVPFIPAHYDRYGRNADGGQTANQTKALESIRKRQYRVGLNLFNKKPERGVAYLTQKGFLENIPRAVAKFFISRKGISKQMIGEYLGNLQNPFNMATLNYFAEELDFTSLDIDVALRKFQTYFRMPGEAQKIERLMEIFGHRYCQCNPQMVSRLRNPDTVFVLAFAIIMLNTDLHTPSIKAEKRMKLEDFIKNLRGIDDGADIDRDLLVGIYDRVKNAEFKPGADHVTQVLKVQQSIVGKKPNLVLPHRRLVCYCRLYEVADATRRERAGLHQREVFLFNDILVVTKIFNKKKNAVTYSFRQSFPLAGLTVTYFESHYYPFGIRLSQRVDNRILIMFNARNDHDRSKFCEDLREAILEMDEMETLRIEWELDKQRSVSRISRSVNGQGSQTLSNTIIRDKADNRDSGVADMDHTGSTSTLEEASTPTPRRPNGRSLTKDVILRPELALKRSTLSNSLLDIHDPTERYQRRGSVGSLDSGMSISFQSSTTNSTMSRDSSPKNLQQMNQVSKGRPLQHQSSFLGNIFHKRERKNSRGSDCVPKHTNLTTPHCTDV